MCFYIFFSFFLDAMRFERAVLSKSANFALQTFRWLLVAVLASVSALEIDSQTNGMIPQFRQVR